MPSQKSSSNSFPPSISLPQEKTQRVEDNDHSVTVDLDHPETPLKIESLSVDVQKSTKSNSISERHQDNEEGVDSAHAWIVDVGSFFVQMFVIGSAFSFGIFLPEYVKEFHADVHQVAFVGSICMFTLFLFATLVGHLDDSFGNNRVIVVGAILIAVGMILASYATLLWHLYLTHGVIVGMGYSCCYISAITIVPQWFKEWRGFAVGMAVAGGGLGQFVMAQVVGHLILDFEWRSTLRYLALIDGCGIILAGVFVQRRLPFAKHFVNAKMDFEVFKDVNFTLLSWGYMFYLYGLLVPTTYLYLYSVTHKIGKPQAKNTATFLFSMYGVANLFGRIIIGWLGDMPKMRVHLIRLCAGCGGIVAFSWLHCRTYNSVLAFALLEGFFGGGVIALVPTIGADLVGIFKISSFLGMLYTVSAIANLVSPPVAGDLYDRYLNFRPAIIMSGVAQLIAMGLFVLMRVPPSTGPTSNSPTSSNAEKSNNNLPLKPLPARDEEEGKFVEMKPVGVDGNLRNGTVASRKAKSPRNF